jgi:hypothetical protein
MKRTIATILAFLYLATSSGATITVHYCMGEFVSKGFLKDNKCGKCGMEKTKEGCCEDEEQVVKTPQDDHSFHTPYLSFAPAITVLQRSYIDITLVFSSISPAVIIHNNSPPGVFGSSLCIRNCVFRI